MALKYTRLLELPNESFILLGIRGVGKSTWIETTLGDAAIVYDLLDETLYSELLVDRSILTKQLAHQRPGTWVVIDEIQRIPGLLNECHRLMEKQKLRFALLGSSARKLRRQGVNLLGGRALSIELYPLTPEELGSDFELENYLSIGGIPLIRASTDPFLKLRGYVQMYLKEEIQQEALVRNLEGYARFIPIAGIFHGQTLNVEALARDSGVARTTVQGYLDILEDTLLTYRLKAFEGKLRVKEKRHPKLYWIDPGLARASKKNFGSLSIEEKGALFEGFIIQLIKTYQSVKHELFDDLFYWSVGKKESSIEVDLLLIRGKEIIAIEIKSGATPNSSWAKGLHALSELKRVSRKIIIYNGTRSYMTENQIEMVTLNDFIEMLINRKL